MNRNLSTHIMRWILFLIPVIAGQLVAPIDVNLQESDTVILNLECGSETRSEVLFLDHDNSIDLISTIPDGKNEILRMDFKHQMANCTLQILTVDRANFKEYDRWAVIKFICFIAGVVLILHIIGKADASLKESRTSDVPFEEKKAS
jgi:hypothetical protein